MRRAISIALCAAILSLPGCVNIAEVLVDAVFHHKRSKAGTSGDESLSKEQRRILWEAEFRQHMKDSEQKYQREQYRKQLNREPTGEWENSIDSAFPPS